MTWEPLLVAGSILGGILAGVVSALIAVSYQARRDRERRHHDLVAAVREGIDTRIAAVVADQKEHNQVLHNKVSQLRDDTVRQLIDRLSNIEGRLRAIDNWMQLLQRKYLGE